MKVEEVGSKGNVTVLRFGEKLIKITIADVDPEIDSDRLCKIDINNLVAEIITTPVIVNRWGNIQAEIRRQFQMEKLNFEIFCAEEKERIRNKANSDESKEGKAKKFTIAEVEDALVSSAPYKVFSKRIIELEKSLEITTSLFWSLKDKSGKLDKLSLTLQKDDLSNLKSCILNGVKIVVKGGKVEEE